MMQRATGPSWAETHTRKQHTHMQCMCTISMTHTNKLTLSESLICILNGNDINNIIQLSPTQTHKHTNTQTHTHTNTQTHTTIWHKNSTTTVVAMACDSVCVVLWTCNGTTLCTYMLSASKLESSLFGYNLKGLPRPFSPGGQETASKALLCHENTSIFQHIQTQYVKKDFSHYSQLGTWIKRSSIQQNTGTKTHSHRKQTKVEAKTHKTNNNTARAVTLGVSHWLNCFNTNTVGRC